MSLIGNLEDLPLADILQIVNLSRRTGLLRLRVPAGQVWVAFRDGRIAAAGTPTRSGRIDDLVVSRRLMGRAQAAAALRGFPTDGSVDPADYVLKHGALDEAGLRAAQSEDLQATLGELFAYEAGHFSFELAEAGVLLRNARRSGRWIHPDGISPQHMLLEATRQVDEAVRGLEGQPAPEIPDLPEPAPPPGPGEGPPSRPARRRPSLGKVADSEASGVATPPPGSSPILIVDDEALYRGRLAAEFERAGFPVASAAGIGEALDICREWAQAGARPVVVVDLLMPDGEGEGFLGGVELVRQIGEQGIGARVLGLCTGRQDEYRQETRGLNIEALVSKPDLTATPLGALPAALQDLVRTLLWQIRNGPRAASADPSDPLAGLEPGGLGGGSPRRVTDPLGFLRGLLGELRQPENPSEVWILVLRVASEFLERAVLFVRRRQRWVAFGGFGPGGGEASVENRVQGMSFGLEENPLLAAAASDRTPRIGAPEAEPGTVPILSALGSLQPTQFAILPVVAGGRQAVALLYLDNGAGEAPLPDLRSLEIFLVQLGLCLENVALQKRMAEAPASP